MKQRSTRMTIDSAFEISTVHSSRSSGLCLETGYETSSRDKASWAHVHCEAPVLGYSHNGIFPGKWGAQ
ncbi:hypothetical protein PENNAL_c0068G03135 [Penicillium nalgiovense]|uniref:Uncharacterized protein n=1 Tax=Penicillium nalgiovense TaxID=60175 RepID=A0A1V6XMD8_PENNA|nr:hypothetical protein PENNAL_c0068G03135 [Penicillium nalgiovense]